MKKHKTINVIDLATEFVTRLNKQCLDAEVAKVYEIDIIKDTVPLGNAQPIINQKKGGKVSRTKNVRVIKFYVHDLDINKRTVLYEATYAPQSPADLLRIDYKTILYTNLIYFCIGFMAINQEGNILTKEAESLVADLKFA